MTNHQRSTLFTVLTLSTMLLAFNIIAVTSGLADGYYAEVQYWIKTLLG